MAYSILDSLRGRNESFISRRKALYFFCSNIVCFISLVGVSGGVILIVVRGGPCSKGSVNNIILKPSTVLSYLLAYIFFLLLLEYLISKSNGPYFSLSCLYI